MESLLTLNEIKIVLEGIKVGGNQLIKHSIPKRFGKVKTIFIYRKEIYIRFFKGICGKFK